MKILFFPSKKNKKSQETLDNEVGPIILEKIVQFSNHMDLSVVNEVIFTHEYEQEIEKYQSQDERYYSEYDKALGTSWGQTIKISNKPEYILVFRIEMIDALLNPQITRDMTELIYHTIQHEMGHVFDGCNLNHIDSVQSLNVDKDLHSALVFWGEYAANKFSIATMPTESEYGIANVLKSYSDILPLIDDDIAIYNKDGDKLSLWNRMHVHIGYLLYVCSHAFGFIDGGIDEDEEKQKVLGRISSVPSHEILYEFYNELNSLAKLYPNWKSYNVLMGLADLYYKCWKIYNIDVIDFNLSGKIKFKLLS